MSRSGGQSEARLPVLKSPSKLDAHLSTHCSRDERLSRSCPAGNTTCTCAEEARYATTRTLGLNTALTTIIIPHRRGDFGAIIRYRQYPVPQEKIILSEILRKLEVGWATRDLHTLQRQNASYSE
ncbi:hypothetical protein TNCV_2282341 [Trichonephila clavipes]|nr:hypothetical protein TNCV_2282341 [Trichonephila clavipes]